jgi:hypothetical protein
VEALPRLTDPEAAREAARLLLDLVFHAGQRRTVIAYPGPPEPGQPVARVVYSAPKAAVARPADALNAIQRRGLAMLAEHDAFWRVPHNLLALYGLPAERDALRQALAAGR